jgi:uncharacterized integral membrane protein (TIGR00697 family)
MIWVLCYIFGQMLELKFIDVPFLTLTTSILVVPVTYILSDCMTEVYGYEKIKFLTISSTLVIIAFIILFQIAIALPPASFWDGQAHFEYMLGSTPRLALAGVCALVSGSLSNAYVMSMLKKLQYRGFKFRALVSSVFGHMADNIVFYAIAFSFVLPLYEMMCLMISNILLKMGIEICVLPITTKVVEYIKQKEEM